MPDACWMAAQLLANCLSDTLSQNLGLEAIAAVSVQPEGNREAASPAPSASETLCDMTLMRSQAMMGCGTVLPQFSRSPQPALPRPLNSQLPAEGMRPQGGSQLFHQRQAALRAGKIYTRLAPSAFADQWQFATEQPTYGQWQALLAQEAEAMTRGQGSNRLTVIVGDSISLWVPPEGLSRDRFWLNQSISGETAAQILHRLPAFAQTRPDTIYLMAGVNDLKQGATDGEVVNNLRLVMQRLHLQHPQARIVVYSILPTRLARIPSDRVRRINQQVAAIAHQQGIDFRDLQLDFADAQGNLNQALTTDGLHLNRQGYQVWHTAMLSL